MNKCKCEIVKTCKIQINNYVYLLLFNHKDIQFLVVLFAFHINNTIFIISYVKEKNLCNMFKL